MDVEEEQMEQCICLVDVKEAYYQKFSQDKLL